MTKVLTDRIPHNARGDRDESSLARGYHPRQQVKLQIVISGGIFVCMGNVPQEVSGLPGLTAPRMHSLLLEITHVKARTHVILPNLGSPMCYRWVISPDMGGFPLLTLGEATILFTGVGNSASFYWSPKCSLDDITIGSGGMAQHLFFLE